MTLARARGSAVLRAVALVALLEPVAALGQTSTVQSGGERDALWRMFRASRHAHEIRVTLADTVLNVFAVRFEGDHLVCRDYSDQRRWRQLELDKVRRFDVLTRGAPGRPSVGALTSASVGFLMLGAAIATADGPVGFSQNYLWFGLVAILGMGAHDAILVPKRWRTVYRSPSAPPEGAGP